MYTVSRTLEFTPLEWLGVVAAADAYNADRPGVPPLSAEQYLQARLKDVAFSYAQQHQQTLAAAALARLAGMAPEAQGQVLAALGVAYVATIPDPAGRAEALGALGLAKYLALDRAAKDELVALVYPEYA